MILVFVMMLLPSITLCQAETDKMWLSFSERQKEIQIVHGEETEIIVDVKRQVPLSNLKLNISIILNSPNIVKLGTSRNCQITLSHESSFPLKLEGKNPGVTEMLVHISFADKDLGSVKWNGTDLHYIIAVGHSKSVLYLITALGWFYVFVWNLSFYPQVMKNFKRKR